MDGEGWAGCEHQLLHTQHFDGRQHLFEFPALSPCSRPSSQVRCVLWEMDSGAFFELSCAEMDCSVFERRGSERLWWEIQSPLLRSVGEVKKFCWKAQNGYFLLDSESQSSSPQLSCRCCWWTLGESWRPDALRMCMLSKSSVPFWSFILEELVSF